MHVVSGHTAVQDILIHTTQQCIHVHLPTVKNRLPSLTIMSYELLILCVIISQLATLFPPIHICNCYMDLACETFVLVY